MKTFHCQCVCLCVTLLSIGYSASALAADFYLIRTSEYRKSWETADDWNSGQAASAGNNYFVGSGYKLRSPEKTTSTFPGAKLYVGYKDTSTSILSLQGGAFQIKSASNTSGTVTVDNLFLGGIATSHSYIQNAIGTSNATINGKITIEGYAEFYSVGENVTTDARRLIVNSTITGGGALMISPQTVVGNTNINVEITSAVASTPYSGAVTVPANAYLKLSGTAFQSASSITVIGKLFLNKNNAISSSGSVVNKGVIDYGTTSQQLNALTGTGTITGSGALTLFNPTTDYTGTISGSGATTMNITDSSVVWKGTITGTGASVTKTGAGTLTLSATNTYTGGTTVSAGTLALIGATNLNHSASITNNATITATSAQTFNNLSGTEGTASINIGTNALTLNNTENSSYAGIISGASSVTKTGTGMLTLSGTNSYTGGTTVSDGTLNLDANNAIENSTSVENNAAITFGTTAQTFNGLTGTGSITGSGALTLFNDTEGNSTYSGTITGTGASITKTGAGTITLSGTNTYSGVTTISAGTLDLGIADAIKSSSSVTNNAAITAASAQMFNNLSGTVNKASITLTTGDLTLNNTADSSYTGNLIAGTINVTGTSGSAATTLKLNGTINGNVTVFSGNLDIKGTLIGGLEVSAGSIFSPGNSIGHTEQTGDFTLNAGAEILYELSAGDYDWLHVSETATFEKDSIIALSYTGALPSSAKSYELLTSTELILNEADFNWNQILIDAGLNTENWTWNIANNNIVLNYAPTEIPVPEPSTWALLILGALGMMYFRRKK